MTSLFDPPGDSPSNPFIAPIQAIFNGPTPSIQSLSSTAADLTNRITNSRDPADSLWEFWDAFFIAIATHGTTDDHKTPLAFLDAIRALPASLPANAPANSHVANSLSSYTASDGSLDWSTLPRFGAQWRDTHDILEARRDWAATEAHDYGVYFLRFVSFSAALLGEYGGRVGTTPVWVFFACKEVFERKGPVEQEAWGERIPQEKAWEIDVRVATMWVIGGAKALWDMDGKKLREHYAAALEQETELWQRGDGLTEARWRLWARRLGALKGEKAFDEATKALVREAAAVLEKLLG